MENCNNLCNITQIWWSSELVLTTAALLSMTLLLNVLCVNLSKNLSVGCSEKTFIIIYNYILTDPVAVSGDLDN